MKQEGLEKEKQIVKIKLTGTDKPVISFSNKRNPYSFLVYWRNSSLQLKSLSNLRQLQ